MPGPIPDPSALDNISNGNSNSQDDSTPLSEVQKRLARSPSKKLAAPAPASTYTTISAPTPSAAKASGLIPDLLGEVLPPKAPSTVQTSISTASSQTTNASKPQPSQNLLGLDFNAPPPSSVFVIKPPSDYSATTSTKVK